MTQYWLMKTEPDAFSFEDLMKSQDSTDSWDGIRNYQARNLMRDQFRLGDKVCIYHSRIAQPAIVGFAEVVREAYPDPTALDVNAKYFDPKSHEQGISRWVMVDVKATHRLQKHVTLATLKETKGFEEMMVIRKGARLSIQPVKPSEFALIEQIGSPLPL